MKFEIFDEEPWPEDQLVPLEVSKGSLILLHGLLPHRSFENRSSRSRHAYTLHLIGAERKIPRRQLATTKRAQRCLLQRHKSHKNSEYSVIFAPFLWLITGP